MERHNFSTNCCTAPVFPGAPALIGLHPASVYHYLSFNNPPELFDVIAAHPISIMTRSTHHIIHNNYPLFMGITPLFVAVIGIAHTPASKRMGIFSASNANPPARLRIMDQPIESVSPCITPQFIQKKLKLWAVVGVYALNTSLLLLTRSLRNNFSSCYATGQGFMMFKVVSEYAISLILLGSRFLLSIGCEVLPTIPRGFQYRGCTR